MRMMIHDDPGPLRPDFMADRKQLLALYESGEISASEYCTQIESLQNCEFDYYVRIGVVIDLPQRREP